MDVNKLGKSCYLCGSELNITLDHVPPENLFPKPRPNNPIKVYCCESCNNSFATDDEAFRVFASSQIARSEAGEWIWKNKVMESSFKRSPKLKENVKKSLLPLSIDPITKKPTIWGTRFPINRGERYLIRVTKGLIKNFYPLLDYSKSKFKVTHLNPTQDILDKTLVKFIYDERGNKVFRFWRVFIEESSAASVWVFVFYDALMFMVEVDLDDVITTDSNP